MYSRILQRQFLKILEVENAEAKLVAIAEKLRTRDAALFKQDIELLERLPNLFSSIDKTYKEYAEQNNLAFHNLEISSAELNEANAELEKLNFSLSAMLDTLGQGIFSFNERGICSNFYSKACLTLIESAPAGRHIADVLNLPFNLREMVEPLLSMLFSNAAAAFYDDFFALLPKKFRHSKGLSIELDYRPILDFTGSMKSILVVATDHTSEITAQALNLKREAAAMRVLRMSGNRNIFMRFFQNAHNYFYHAIWGLSNTQSLDMVRREVHTIKGNASIFYLLDFVDFLRELEVSLDTTPELPMMDDIFKARAPEALRLLSDIRSDAVAIFGEDFDSQGSTHTISLDLLRAFALELRHSENDALADHFVSTIMGEPIHKPLAIFDIGLQDMAERYEKKISPCVFTGENFLLLTENYAALFSSLTHIARNIVAHAIDSPDARNRENKPPALTVTLDTQRFTCEGKPWFRLNITDDGCGINVARLRNKIRDIKKIDDIDDISDDEAMQFVFENNLSTRDRVEDSAGRGIGMNAVKVEAEHLGGRVRAESTPNRFTRIIIEVPMIWD